MIQRFSIQSQLKFQNLIMKSMFSPHEILVNVNDYISELFTQTQFSEVKTVKISLLLYVFLNKWFPIFQNHLRI